MRSDDEHFWKQIRQALATDNALTGTGDNSHKKRLVITTCMESRPEPGFTFEAKIPRSAGNDLGLTLFWGAGAADITRTDAADFLRKLASLIEETAP